MKYFSGLTFSSFKFFSSCLSPTFLRPLRLLVKWQLPSEMWSRLKLDSALLTRSRSRSLVGPPDPLFIRFGRALFLFGSLLLYRWISSFKDLAQSRFELWFDLDGRWQRKRSDNRDYVPSVEERKWKFWNFPQWLAEALFVTIDASEQRIMMPGICSQRKKRSLPQMDQTSKHKKIDIFSCHIPCVSTDLSALPKKAVWSKVGNLRLWAATD